MGKKSYPPVNTTPESLDIIKCAKETLERGGKYLILEVSSQGIDNFRIEGLRFAGAIFTNLSKEHLECHKNMEEYYLVKERLFKQVKEGGVIVP
ncbi:Mur ligase family protein [Psychrilyobacter sp.]|uniref:Mur ligase family protein n=1 Tax=Psychrilyobacter sp. TaxID=2586924 RepID=UPI003018FEE4